MIIQQTISIPANTPISDSIIEEIKLSIGIIYQIDIYFPPGSCGLAGVCIDYNEVQLFPNKIGEYFTGDNNTITFPDTEIIKDPPYILKVIGYNLDTVYDHTVTIRVGFEGNDNLIIRYLPTPIKNIIKAIDENNVIKEQQKLIDRQEIINNRLKKQGVKI